MSKLTELEQQLLPLANRIANLIATGVVNLADDTGQMQLLQIGVLADENIEGVPHFQPYGFGSVPEKGAEVVALFLGGDREHPIAIVTADRRNRPTGHEPGEVFLWHKSGAKILMTEDGDVEIEPATGRKLYVKRAGQPTVPVATKDDVDSIYNAITGAATAAGDGGAAYKAAMKVLMDIDRPYGADSTEVEK